MCIFPVKKTASTQCWIEWYPNYIIFSFFLLADCPCLGVYIYILQVVILDIVAFFISVLALILGFAFAFHLILQKSSSTKEGDQNLFKNPITSLIAVLTMAVGHFGVSDEVMASSLVPGTTEAMFVIFYFLFSIGKCKLLFVQWLLKGRNFQKYYIGKKLLIYLQKNLFFRNDDNFSWSLRG